MTMAATLVLDRRSFSAIERFVSGNVLVSLLTDFGKLLIYDNSSSNS